MDTRQGLNTVWELVNLLEKLSNLLFDKYHDYLIERYLDEKEITSFENHIQNLIREQPK